MYAAYFGLDENPFSITPDPRYLYLGQQHAEALAHLLYGIREGGGFIQLTGEVGTGKTTLTRSLLDELPDDVDVALILNPRLTIEEFLAAICQELGVDIARDATNREKVDALNRHLLESHAAGRRTVLIVDEAQNLSADVLEQVRLLTNLETAKTKLLQILLIGQPELRQTLARADLRQLAQRITARYHLEPLGREELADYIHHRLEVAGARAPLFSNRALKKVFHHSSGIPRLANVICDRALLGAYTREQREVTGGLVDDAAREVMGPTLEPRSGNRWRWPLLAAAVIAAAGIGYLATPVVEEKPTVAEPARATFSDWLADHAAQTDTDTALRTLFSRWGETYRSTGAPACEQARDRGLRCLYEQGSWLTLQRLDRPAVLSLIAADGSSHQAVIVSIADDEATLLAGPARTRVNAGELGRRWTGEYLALWQPPPGVEGALSVGAEGPGVIWLRDQLDRVLGPTDRPEQPQRYDAALAERVREFQARESLRVDGIAGEQTLARLVALQDAAGLPRLDEVG
ncbi:MAG: AAA family ATPase [Gammaproteobacteria bacterium]|nr:AAA family ATPase [Gammaproteobacteria bacterium]